MTSTWYIARNKQKFGPFSTKQLQQLATLGLVKPTEFVLEVGARQWVPANSIAGIFPAVQISKNYWLALEGKSQGPYPAEQIRVGLMRGQLAGDTLACLEGGKQWTPLAQLAEFQPCVSSPTRSSQAHLGLGSSHLHLNEEEAELHLAGKQGDKIARLLSTLLDMKRRYQGSPSMVAIIDKNIQDLKAIRAKGWTRGAAPPAMPK